jgi:hypothetical protein
MQETIKQIYQQGASIREVSRRVGLSWRAVREILSKEGVLLSRTEAVKRNLEVARERLKDPEVKKIAAAKRVLTNMERFGAVAPACNPEIMAKIMANKPKDWLERLQKGNMARTNRKEVAKKILAIRLKNKTVHAGLLPENLKKMVDEGLTRRQISKKIGAPYKAVKTAIYRNGMEKETQKQKDSWNELKVATFLEESGIAFKRNCRGIIKDKEGKQQELDFYLPDHKVAIEVNDFLTHNANYHPFGEPPKLKRYHLEKTLSCEQAGIRLIHAWEHCLPDTDVKCTFGNWEVLKNCILSACGMYQNRLYARDCEVVIFPALRCKDFFKANNINSYRAASIVYALIKKGEVKTPDNIIMAYAVGEPSFGKGKYDVEIARGACRLGWQVVGGASKLWKTITDEGYSSIVYYVDRNYYNANSMDFLANVEKVGHRVSFWNYWVEEKRLKNREPSRHKEIMALMKENRIWAVYNAGTDVWVWRKQSI